MMSETISRRGGFSLKLPIECGSSRVTLSGQFVMDRRTLDVSAETHHRTNPRISSGCP